MRLRRLGAQLSVRLSLCETAVRVARQLPGHGHASSATLRQAGTTLSRRVNTEGKKRRSRPKNSSMPGEWGDCWLPCLGEHRLLTEALVGVSARRGGRCCGAGVPQPGIWLPGCASGQRKTPRSGDRGVGIGSGGSRRRRWSGTGATRSRCRQSSSLRAGMRRLQGRR